MKKYLVNTKEDIEGRIKEQKRQETFRKQITI